jgi:hypothetical protein
MIGGCLEESRGGGGGGGGEDLLRFLVTCTRVPRRGDGVSGIENRRKGRN